MTKKAPPKKAKTPTKKPVKTVPVKASSKKDAKKPILRRRKSLAQVRGSIEDARRWYIQGLIPAEGKRPETRQPSLQDVSVASGTAYRTLERRSKGEGWVAQREEFASKALEVENARLVQAMGDGHARARTAYFRTSLRLQGIVERKLVSHGEALDMTDLSAAGSALRKAQDTTDISVMGSKAAAQGPATQVNAQINVGWPTVAGQPSASLQASLSSLDEAS